MRALGSELLSQSHDRVWFLVSIGDDYAHFIIGRVGGYGAYAFMHDANGIKRKYTAL